MKIDVKFATESFAPIFGSITEIGGGQTGGGYTQAEVDRMVADAKDAATNDFWDVIQNHGIRDDYSRAFRDWDCEYIRPKYKVVPIHNHSTAYLFHRNASLKKIEAKHFDFSQKEKSTNATYGYAYFCGACTNLEEIEDVGIQPEISLQYAFYYCYNLHTIAKLRVDENTQYSSTFTRCDSLANLTVEGTIGKTGFNVSWSPLTHDSLMSIINALGNTGSAMSITLGTANLAKLTDAEKAIATQKGWTLA